MAAGSSSSSARLVSCGDLPHISSRRLGGSALTGTGAPRRCQSEGVSQASGPSGEATLQKLRGLRWRVPADDGAPSTTAISRLPSRVAVATRLKPEAQMKPVFMPSAPG